MGWHGSKCNGWALGPAHMAANKKQKKPERINITSSYIHFMGLFVGHIVVGPPTFHRIMLSKQWQIAQTGPGLPMRTTSHPSKYFACLYGWGSFYGKDFQQIAIGEPGVVYCGLGDVACYIRCTAEPHSATLNVRSRNETEKNRW